MQGFYKRPAVGNYLYGDMTGHRIDFVGILDGVNVMYVSDDDCPIPEPMDGEPAWQKFVPSADEIEILKPQCASDLRDQLFPPQNLDLFFELFAKETALGTFTAEQHGTMKLLADIKQDIAFRNMILAQAASQGTDAQRAKLAEIAVLSGVELPL